MILSLTVFPELLTAGFEPGVMVILSIILLIPIVIFFVWIGLYYKSIWYELCEDEMSWKRAVWFQRTGIVPYNRIHQS